MIMGFLQHRERGQETMEDGVVKGGVLGMVRMGRWHDAKVAHADGCADNVVQR